jgi:hypothetical protein
MSIELAYLVSESNNLNILENNQFNMIVDVILGLEVCAMICLVTNTSSVTIYKQKSIF